MRFHQASTHFSNTTLALKVLSTLASLSVMLAFSAAASAAATGNFDGPAELPRVYVQTDLAHTPAPGTVISVPSGGNFKEALNNANCGDTIKLRLEQRLLEPSSCPHGLATTRTGSLCEPARQTAASRQRARGFLPVTRALLPFPAAPPSIAPPPRMSWRRFKSCVQEAVGPC